VKVYRAVVVRSDADQTPRRVRVLTESESEARRMLEQQYGKDAVLALQDGRDKPPVRRPRK
jgi:hypothetical protein